MSEENKKMPAATVEEMEKESSVLRGRLRNVEMFKDYFKGMKRQELADKYGISIQRVDFIKKRDKWEKIAQKLRDKAYSAMAHEFKDLLGKVALALKKDWERVVRKVVSDDTVTLSADERTHGRMLLDYLVKASRLADDKPTEISGTSGVVTHRVLLPEGVKRYGVIPPDSNVQQIEHKESEKDKSKIDVDDIDDLD
jgi:hypothetical protein